MVLVKFYCDIITEAVTAYQHFDRHLCSKLCAFLANKEEEGRPVMVKRKLDGARDKFSANRNIHKWDATVHSL